MQIINLIVIASKTNLNFINFVRNYFDKTAIKVSEIVFYFKFISSFLLFYSNWQIWHFDNCPDIN
jgi:hypothetical protein